MKKKQLYLLLLAVVLVVSLVTACASGTSEPTEAEGEGSEPSGSETETNDEATTEESEDDVIKIGVIVSETGPASSLGKPESDAVKLIQQELEENGGEVNGKKVEIIVEDYETDDTKAVVAAKRLISEENVVALVAASQASATMAVLGEAAQENIPVLALAPIDQHPENVFQIPQSNETVLNLVIDYLEEHGIDKVAWIQARDTFGQSGLSVFEELAEANDIELVAIEEFEPNDTDMTVQLTKIRSEEPGAIIVWSRPPGAGIVAKNFKQLGFDIPMFQSHAVANQGFLDQLGDEGDDILVLGSKMSVVDQLPDSEQKTMFEEYDKQFSDAFGYDGGAFSGYAYDGVNVVLKAIEDGNFTPEEVRDYLENDLGEYMGISGTFNFSPDHRDGPENDGMTILRIQDGQWMYDE